MLEDKSGIAYLTAHRGSDGLSGKADMPAFSEAH